MIAIEYITDPNKAAPVAAQLGAEPIIGVDIETTGLDCHTARIRLVSVATLDGRVVVFDLASIPVAALAALSGAHWIAYSSQFEQQHMTEAGFMVPRLDDAMLLDRLACHRLRKLDAAAGDVLGLELDKTLQTSDWSGELSTEQIEYAALDAFAAIRLGVELRPKIERRGQWRLYRLWMDAARVLAELSRRGHCIDWPAHDRLQAAWTTEQTELKGQLGDVLGTVKTGKRKGKPRNPNSGPQLGEWLRQELDLPRLEAWPVTPTGRFKTDAATLGLAADLPGVQQLLRYKAISKLVGTYGKGYARWRHPITDRLHPNYSIGFTVTGRVSASKPNTQNPPRMTEFRQVFVPADGYSMVGADFGQIELRVAALLSRDPAMIKAYADGADLHSITAAAITQTPLDSITPEQRRAAKAVNFGSLFGQRGKGLARVAKLNYSVSMTEADADAFLSRHSAQFPQLVDWQRRQINQARNSRQVVTRLGLIRDFDAQRAGYLAGEAMNVPIQGSAAEVQLEALTRLPAALAPIGAVLSHNIHDEIVIETPKGSESAACSALSGAMLDGWRAVFPEAEQLGLAGNDLIEIKAGDSWRAVH